MLDTFNVEGERQLGEEDPPVKGAGVVVARAKGVQPLVRAVIAQVVASLREFRSAVFPSSVAQGVIGVGANGAVVLIFRKALSLDVRAGLEERRWRRYWYRIVCMLVVSGEVSTVGSTLRGSLPKVPPASVSIQSSGKIGVIQLGLA